MAIKKSAKKELRKNLKRKILNLERKRKIKISIKNFLKALKEKNREKAEEYLRLAFKNLDKAAKRFYKKNKASRIKSKLSKKFNLAFSNS
ncbi:MAG: 30S ribosomal protein S20 [Minisyncoccia bacterium]